MKMESSNKDLYDYFEKLLNQNDLAWCLQFWDSKPLFSLTSRIKIHEEVLKSPAVQSVINELSQNDPGAKNVVKRANMILEEMEHNFDMKSIRVFGYFLSKLLRKLFRGLIINKSGIDELREALQNCPVVLLPTHRSYIDFLLISYVCFAFKLPMPVIAAGADFKEMAVFGWLLRNAGAFFIRRSFGDDKLYWVLVTQYIQYHLKNSCAPVEFFIEGTRSRCGKALPPKQGMLSMVLEPYMKLEITDVALCPVSISYDRSVEELLYAKELLGIPKPKESTKGLFNAVRRISSENYGRIYVNVGAVVYARKMLPKRILPNWNSNGEIFAFSELEKSLVYKISQEISRNLQLGCVVPNFSIVAAALSTGKEMNRTELESLFQDFINSFEMLRVPYVVEKTVKDDVDLLLEVHKNKIQLCGDGKIRMQFDLVDQLEEHEKRAIPRLILQIYSNQLLAQLIGPAVYYFIKTKTPDSVTKAQECFKTVLRNEFLLLESVDQQDYEQSGLGTKIQEILCSLLVPYVNSAYFLLNVILQGFSTNPSIKDQYCRVVLDGLGNVLGDHYEMLAMDQIHRHLDNLVFLKILNKKKNDKSVVQYQVDYYQLQKLADGLEPYISTSVIKFINMCFSSSKVQARL